MTKSELERFWDKVEINEITGCCVWTGSVSKYGYGHFKTDTGKMMRVHRYSFLLNHSIPKGLVIDHLCRNRLCVKFEHLELVTQRENVMRGIGITSLNAKKTECKRGHKLSGCNLIIQNNQRKCRTCKNLRNRGEI